MNTSVVFGFVKFLRDIQKRERPDLLGVAFDPKGGSFRREIFPEYKANRSETPEDILISVPYVKRVLEAMCIPILEVEGYEADDVIGTLSQKGAAAGYDVYMVTPDKDYGQLVREHCRIYKQKGSDGAIEIVDREAIRQKYGIDDPVLVRDILALWGDASDNIPGVPGIGEKTACKLVQEWERSSVSSTTSLRSRGGRARRSPGWGDNLRLAKRLTTICLDVPIDFSEEELTVCAPHLDDRRRSSPNSTSRPSSTIWPTSRPPSRCPTDRVRRSSASWPRWTGRSPRRRKRPRWPVRATSSASPSNRFGVRFPLPSCRRLPTRCSSARRRTRPRIPAGGRCRVAPAACRRALRAGRVLFRHRDDGARHLQRPHRRHVVRRRTPQGVVRALQRGVHGRICRDHPSGIRESTVAKIGQNGQVRPDGAPAARVAVRRAQVRYD